MGAEYEIVQRVVCRDGAVCYIADGDSAEETFGEDVEKVERFALVKIEEMVAMGMMS